MTQVVVGPVSSSRSTISVEEFVSLATTSAMFGAQTFIFSGVLTGESGEEVLEMAAVFKDSPHTFVFEEEKLLKKQTDALAKAGIKIKEARGEKKEWKFDQFGITTALAARDKKRLRLGLMEALHSGEKAEALAGLLAWKARAMGGAELSRELVFMYHDSHRGAGDLELLLERFALKL